MQVVYLAFNGQRIEQNGAGVKGAIGWTAGAGSDLVGLVPWCEKVLRFAPQAAPNRMGRANAFPAGLAQRVPRERSPWIL